LLEVFDLGLSDSDGISVLVVGEEAIHDTHLRLDNVIVDTLDGLGAILSHETNSRIDVFFEELVEKR